MKETFELLYTVSLSHWRWLTPGNCKLFNVNQCFLAEEKENFVFLAGVVRNQIKSRKPTRKNNL